MCLARSTHAVAAAGQSARSPAVSASGADAPAGFETTACPIIAGAA